MIARPRKVKEDTLYVSENGKCVVHVYSVYRLLEYSSCEFVKVKGRLKHDGDCNEEEFFKVYPHEVNNVEVVYE